ncbi:MAG: sigma-54-dependent Fis family transcriptional regulator [Dethiobacteria bacterium]|jgi:transcriptional regulator with PAS, ATPase and Fis domain
MPDLSTSTQFKKENLEKAWELFMSKGIIDPGVRSIIAQSWQRSRLKGVNPSSEKTKKLEPDLFRAELAANADLLATAVPIIKNLYNFVQGSCFLISLASSNGIILEVLGDEEIVVKSHVKKGDIWTEESNGTNSTSLCLTTQKPIQVFAAEHFCKSAHQWTCSSAPIFDENKKFIGVLNMAGDYTKVHLHTLGMVVASANAIENNMRIQKSLNEATIADNFKTAIIESIDEGILVLNRDRTVGHINSNAKILLKIPADRKVISQPIATILGDIHPVTRKIEKCFQQLIDDEILFLEEEDYIISHRLIYSSDQKIVGLVLILRGSSKMKKLVNSYVGPRATYTFANLIGKSSKFLAAVNLAHVAAQSISNVLLVGESGTGKEIFAQAIHNAGDRKTGPFLAINCAALPRNLVESELFGYAEGAFTGAKKGGNPGKFELADGGTLFLDEIGELPLEFQAILLRVLQDKLITRIGGKKLIPVDVRIIAATNKNLEEEIVRANFRQDLYYRLNVLTINIPPLRDRPEDIVILANHFLNKLNLRLNKKIKYIDKEVMELFTRYSWPGNARELQNILERSLNIATKDHISPAVLPGEITALQQKENNSELMPLEQYEKELILTLLNENQGNRTQVAKRMGISRTSLYRKLNKYKIS